MRGSLSRLMLWVLLIIFLVGMTGLFISRRNGSVDATLMTSTLNEENQTESGSEEFEGYQRAQGAIELIFPRDHGPHPDYQTEWWYYTGNLETADGRHFGYQLTFFRRTLIPNNVNPTRRSKWATNQIYMAHFAVTDVQTGKFHNFERFSRSSIDLAGAQPIPFHVWLFDWHVEQVDERTYHLQAEQEEISIDLEMTYVKGPILHGDDGYSQKGPESGNASYYISQTRLHTSGKLKIMGQDYAVTGASWMDHEFSTSALTADQVGWDWFSIQLNLEGKENEEGQPIELMVFQIRKADGSIDPFSSGTLIYPDGSTKTLSQKDFNIESLEVWRSPRSGGIYPSRWIIDVPAEELQLSIKPYLADQELNVSFDYWEGAVKINGSWSDQPVEGDGYVELTGYSASLAGEF